MESRTYEVGSSRVTLRFGDIVTSRADVLVSSDDYLLSMGGGVSAAIRRSGGARIAIDASKMTPARIGDVVVTTAGDLSARYIFHAITIGATPASLPAGTVVRQAVRRVMDLLRLLGCKSVAFPAIGAGVARIPYEIVASEMACGLVAYLLDVEEAFDVHVYLLDRFGGMDRDDFFIFFERFAAQTLGVSTREAASSLALQPPSVPAPSMDAKQLAEAQRRSRIHLMLRHLDARRNQVEGKLLQALTIDGSTETRPLAHLTRQLDELQALRRSYEAELSAPADALAPTVIDSVFVSSTSMDLKPHRDAVRGVIEDLRLTFIGMEEFSPTSLAPADLIRRKVLQAQVYVGILGMRYGFVDPGTGLSMTELEYRQATASDKRICMFVMDQNAPILARMVEDDPSRFAKLIDFRNRVMTAHTCALFTEVADLARKAEAALRGLGFQGSTG